MCTRLSKDRVRWPHNEASCKGKLWIESFMFGCCANRPKTVGFIIFPDDCSTASFLNAWLRMKWWKMSNTYVTLNHLRRRPSDVSVWSVCYKCLYFCHREAWVSPRLGGPREFVYTLAVKAILFKDFVNFFAFRTEKYRFVKNNCNFYKYIFSAFPHFWISIP
jgi:hypothetical protein